MLSHDSRLRCELVDLYYTLYGIRKPTCLPIPELAGVLNLQKHDVKKMKSFSTLQKPSTITSTLETKRNSPSLKEGSSDIIVDNNVECVNVEIVAKDLKAKVSVLGCCNGDLLLICLV